MIEQQWDATNAILTIHPQSPLHTSDFAALANTLDPEIAQAGEVAGLIIDAPRFPGWSNVGAVLSHIRFIREHHKHIRKIAVVTDSPIADVARHLISPFISAQINRFHGGQTDQARSWIAGAD